MALWRAKQAKVRIAGKIASIGTTATLYDQQTSALDWSGEVKSISISGAEADLDSVFLFGADSDGRQNADIEESNMTMREFSGTLVYKDEDAAELTVASASSLGGSASDFNRITGDTTRVQKSILVQFTDGTNTVNILMNNAYFTKMGDISLDAEGHAEQEITAKCLAKDYCEESDFN